MIFRLFLVLMMLVVPVSTPVLAQYNPVFETLASFNRKQPLQNPAYERMERMLDRRVLDRKNKVIGEIQSIILSESGSIAMLGIEFNRLGLPSEVFMNFRQARPKSVTNGYALGFDSDQIEQIYPNLLSNIETAAGSGDLLDLKRLKNAQVKAENGRILGSVSNVLFSERGGRAEALYIKMNYGPLNGEHIAIPFSMGKISDSGRARVLVSNQEADAMIGFAESR